MCPGLTFVGLNPRSFPVRPPRFKELSWPSSLLSPRPSSAPSALLAQPPGAAADWAECARRLYRSVPPHSTAVNPVRAGAGTSFCSRTAVCGASPTTM